MAKTAERKLEVARRDPRHLRRGVRAAAGRPDLRRADLHARHRPGGVRADARIETLEGIRAIKQRAAGRVDLLGVSNVSFGLAPHARAVLNSVFLLPRGRGGARPGHRQPGTHHALRRDLGRGARAGRGPDLQPPAGRAAALHRPLRASHRRPPEAAAVEDPFEGLTADERIHRADPAPQAGRLEDARPGDRRRGDRGNARRRPAQQRAAAGHEGRRRPLRRGRADPALRAPVGRGDEALRRATWSSTSSSRRARPRRGWCWPRCSATCTTSARTWSPRSSPTTATPCRPGQAGAAQRDHRDRPIEVESADAIGLSALLVSTSKQMPLCVHELDRRGLHLPVLIGGAAINRSFGRRIAFLEDGRPYEPGVFYCKDAFEGLAVMERLSDPDMRPAVIAERRQEALEARDAPPPAPPPADRRCGARLGRAPRRAGAGAALRRRPRAVRDRRPS